MKTNHTPTPWVQNKIFGKPAFNIQSGQISIAMVYENIGSNVLNDRDGEGEANAQFIVKAVNHHDELVTALSLLRDAAQRVADGHDKHTNYMAKMCLKASDVLAKATA